MNPSTIPVTQASRDVGTIGVYDGEVLLGTATTNGNTWSFTTQNLPLGLHTFTARSTTARSNEWRISITEEEMNLEAPHVREASLVASNRERLDYYEVNDDIHCMVDYNNKFGDMLNMKPGDTVKAYWVGRNITIGSPIQTVGDTPSLQPFLISKYEVIDAIGHNASLYYTVKRPPSTETFTSLTLLLTVDGHSFQVDAPTINGAHDNLRVQKQPQFYSDTTASVRAIGAGGDEWSADITPTPVFGSNAYLNFKIDPSWLARNRGKPALFNCSIRLTPSDPHYLFSQLLRIASV
ncbi:Ig-like domain-containing protein [Pseudomonas graminis]|uniref:Ig-like domain-containing protein n=1 Tax=Pseudomonas graminis TaxID=158627 RepID=UPI00234A0ED1|nr:Ig-like domain-containing protein [Pseudomonas graminis]MDC6381345.1 Ig-like domain-containing protein [Pseudomonas graminis]